MLEMIYSGNAKAAKTYFYAIWPEDKQAWLEEKPVHREEFLDDFRIRLQASPYWSAIAVMNGRFFFWDLDAK